MNAGHPPGLLVQRSNGNTQRIVRLADGGPVLGVLQDAVYRNASIDAHEGDLLVLFSDGIVEAMNSADEFFGEGRLLEVIARDRQQPSDGICRAILSAVQQFSGRRPAEDDRTVLVIRLWRATGESAGAV